MKRAEHDRLAAVPLEELVRLAHVRRVDPAAPARIAFGLPDDARPDGPADRIVHRVAGHGRGDQQHEEHADVERAAGGERAGREQQRIARAGSA